MPSKKLRYTCFKCKRKLVSDKLHHCINYGKNKGSAHWCIDKTDCLKVSSAPGTVK